MSGRDDLREYEDGRSNGSVIETTHEGMLVQLTDLIGAAQVGRTVVGATVFGRGTSASVDLLLSGDVKVTFLRFGDISKPPALTAGLMASLGIARTFKITEAALIGALIHRLAQHHSGQDADETAREWGAEFLRVAPLQEVKLDDQAERWRAFSSLSSVNPDQFAGADAQTLASASVVLVDQAGVRLVRCGWFLSYIRHQVGGLYTPELLGTQMARVGWERRGTEGWIKATCPGAARFLRWRFYSVPKGWEDTSP